MHHEGVVDLDEGIDLVDVGREENGRLGLADRNEAIWLAAEQPGMAPKGVADLGVDVERVGVAGVLELSVAGRIRLLYPAEGVAQDPAAFQPDTLCGHGDVHAVGPHDLAMHERPVG